MQHLTQKVLAVARRLRLLSVRDHAPSSVPGRSRRCRCRPANQVAPILRPHRLRSRRGRRRRPAAQAAPGPSSRPRRLRSRRLAPRPKLRRSRRARRLRRLRSSRLAYRPSADGSHLTRRGVRACQCRRAPRGLLQAGHTVTLIGPDSHSGQARAVCRRGGGLSSGLDTPQDAETTPRRAVVAAACPKLLGFKLKHGHTAAPDSHRVHRSSSPHGGDDGRRRVAPRRAA